MALYDTAIKLAQKKEEWLLEAAFSNKGITLRQLGRYEEANIAFQKSGIFDSCEDGQPIKEDVQ